MPRYRQHKSKVRFDNDSWSGVLRDLRVGHISIDGAIYKQKPPPPTATPSPTPTATATAPPTNEVTTIQRTYYSIAGQTVGVRVKKVLTNGSTESDDMYYMYTDHLGNVGALSDKNGTYISGSLTLFRPFGDFRRVPSTNPDITDHAFTGHKSHYYTKNPEANHPNFFYGYVEQICKDGFSEVNHAKFSIMAELGW